jgi:hypothetical protein
MSSAFYEEMKILRLKRNSELYETALDEMALKAKHMPRPRGPPRA